VLRRIDEPGRDRRPSSGPGHASRATAKPRTEESKAILPKKTLGELGRLLAEGDGDISYERGENHLFFKSADGC
jgi:hypothetical protein